MRPRRRRVAGGGGGIEYVDSSTGELIDLDTSDGPARALLAQQVRIERLADRLDLAAAELDTVQEQMEDTASSAIDGVTAWTWSALGPLGADIGCVNLNWPRGDGLGWPHLGAGRG